MLIFPGQGLQQSMLQFLLPFRRPKAQVLSLAGIMKAIESSPAADSNNSLYRDYITKTGAGSRLGNKSNSSIKLSAGLACLQFSFAIYATFLLYYLSSTVDPIITGPERASWMTQQWSRLFPQRSGRQPEALHGRSVCQWEEIGFSQKISNDSHMVAIKTGLFRYFSCLFPKLRFFTTMCCSGVG